MAAPLDHAVDRRFFRNDEEKETFLRRLNRAIKRKPQQSSVEDIFQDALKIQGGQDGFKFSVKNLHSVMNQHPKSKTVMKLLKSAVCSLIGMEALDRGDSKTAVSALAEAYRKHSQVVQWESGKLEAAQKSFNALYSDINQETKVRSEALFVHANLLFLQGHIKQGLIQINIAQRILAPNEDPYFAAIEGCILSMRMELSKAQKAFQKAAKLGCSDPEHTLFHRAIIRLKLGHKNTTSLLEDYVECAQPDARKLPEAYYRLAISYGLKGPKHLGAAKRFYIRGEKADQDRIASLFPDEAKELRIQAGALVKRYHFCARNDCSSSATNICSACAQVYYCGEECQRADWAAHKAFCKLHRQKSTKV